MGHDGSVPVALVNYMWGSVLAKCSVALVWIVYLWIAGTVICKQIRFSRYGTEINDLEKEKKKITKRRLQRSTDKVTFAYITMDFTWYFTQKKNILGDNTIERSGG